MLHKFKTLISFLGIIALILTTFSAISFADRGEREYRRDTNSGRYDHRFDNRDSRSRGDRYDRDRDDREDDGDDDDVAAPTPSPLPPVVEPTPPVVEPTPPVVEPTPPVVEPTPPVVEPTPPVVVEPTPPALDGAALYNENCAGCHGQANYGKNVPSSHLSGRVNLTPEELAAINAL